uniref:Uncharacterized protein n=1 Tax=Rhizobium leguminosarum TaxID=384 RepID=A0A179BWG4_RHILE|nr:hypothetical protein A4U53_38825 [Rhizobium leguminosarum]
MQFAPSFAFGLVLCLFSSHSPSPKTFKPVLSTTRWTGPDVVARDFVDGNASPLLRRDRVETSGTAISNPISAAVIAHISGKNRSAELWRLEENDAIVKRS